MSAPKYAAAVGGAKLIWEMIKTATNVATDPNEPMAKRIVYGLGAAGLTGGVGWLGYYFLKNDE